MTSEVALSKECKRCLKVKPLEDFSPGDGAQGRRTLCRPCRREHERELFRQSPSRRRARKNAQMKCLYGITLDDYAAMVAKQNNRCAICNGPPPAGRRLAIDHNHETGTVRGLLCNRCNALLGLLENSDLLSRAQTYLEEEFDDR